MPGARVPRSYFPLRHRFEQKFHVPAPTRRYRTGRFMGFDAETPETIGQRSTTGRSSPMGRRRGRRR